jgi:hypothetical protein
VAREHLVMIIDPIAAPPRPNAILTVGRRVLSLTQGRKLGWRTLELGTDWQPVRDYLKIVQRPAAVAIFCCVDERFYSESSQHGDDRQSVTNATETVRAGLRHDRRLDSRGGAAVETFRTQSPRNARVRCVACAGSSVPPSARVLRRSMAR